MRYVFITGASRGLGKAIATAFLRDLNCRVFGLSKSIIPSVSRLTQIQIDLSDQQEMASWVFPQLPDADELILINNAGSLDPIRYSGTFENDAIIRLLQLNLTTPILLTNSFLRTYADSSARQCIVNISSGAGKYPVDGWSAYCASKAGLDLFTHTVHKELKLSGKTNTFIFSIAPGIVDTAMQRSIRNCEKQHFSRVEEFKTYHNSGKLISPEIVANNYLRIFDNPERYTDPVFSIQDISVAATST